MKKPICKLSIMDLRIWVHLGCSAEERVNPQLVHFDIELKFASPPVGMKSDKLEDTVCYLAMVRSIQHFCQNKHFNLIEHLVAGVYQQVNEVLAAKQDNLATVEVKINKINAPVPGVHGGVHFSYCD